MTHYSLGLYLFGLLLLADVGVSQLRRSSKSSGSVSSGVSSSGSSSSSGTSASQIVDFDCPEEFGYYPHPGDCTQYYVCVFGGALLESCTGGLMYSHELQTCDWPRNVGCGEAASAVSTVKAVEPRPRQPIQLRPQHQPQQLQAHQQQQQYVQQRPLQRDEAIPKHHLYAEEDLGPAEEVESDRQQRVYRGQPATLGQVARDRDGLSRHSNALQVSPPNGREKLSVISFGTQQQYSRQTIQPASYVEPTTTQRVTSRGYNTTQHQQYTPSPYDPYYNIYEDDTDLYKDIDYSQYSGQQYQAQPAYKDKQSQVPQQQVQTTPSRKPSVQYSPPPPPPQPQQSYNTVQQDVFSQAVGSQDYNDNYNLQDEDIDYKQSDLDLKNNRSRLQPQKANTLKVEKIGETENHQNISRNRQLTLTAALTFDDEKTPVTSSKRFEENARKRASISSFRVEEPPSNGPIRETHEMVLSYIKQENEKYNFTNEQENKTETENDMKIKQPSRKETLPKNNPKPISHYSENNKRSHFSSTTFPTQDVPVLLNEESKLRSARPFRIVVPSTTENTDSDQVTFRPRITSRRGNRVQNETPDTNNTPTRQATVKPYKLPPLIRESLSSQLPQEASSLTEPTKRSKNIQEHSREEQTSLRQAQTEKKYLDNSDAAIKSLREYDDEIIKFIPIMPQRSPSKNTQQEKFEADKVYEAYQDPITRVAHNDKRIKTQEEHPSPEESTSTDPSQATRSRNTAHQRMVTQYTSTNPPEEESIFKFIPINAVREKLPNQENNNKNVFLSDDKSDSITHQKKTTENMTADNNQANFSQNKEYNPQINIQTSTDNNVNLFNYQDSFFEENIKHPYSTRINNGRTHSRFSQTTETPVMKPLHSLRIDSESRNYKGQVNGATTVETIPNDNPRSNLTQEIKTKNLRLSNLEQKITSDQINEALSKGNEEEYKISYTNGNNNSDQMRARIRGRTFATTIETSRDEYSRPRVYTTTTDTSGNEPVVSPLRARIRTRPMQNKAESENSDNTYLTSEPKSITEKQETPTVRDYTVETPTEEIYKNKTNTNFSDSQSRFASNLDTYNKNYQKRRQLKIRDRLSPVFQGQGSVKEDAIFDSEEESQSINNNKVTTESDLPINDGFAHRGTQIWNTTADEVFETEDDDSEYDRKFTDEREHNTRQMHTKKRIRFTTSQPQTQRYDSYNNFKSRAVSLKPTNEDLISSTENKLSGHSVDEVYHQLNKETESPNTVSLSRDWLVTKAKDVDDDENNYHTENNYQSRRRDQTQVKSRNNTVLKSSTPFSTVDPYTLIRQSSSSKENFDRLNTREFTNSQVQSNLTARNEIIDVRSTVVSQTYSPIAAEINSYFKEVSTSSTSTYTPIVDTRSSTTPSPTPTFERIRDKFRLGSFPKPTPPSHGFARKPSVEDSTPPALPSDRCSQELDNESECNDKPVLRIRPTSASPDSQATPGLTRGSSRNRGSATYTIAPNEAEPASSPNRGTPSSLSRNRPTLKPSTAIVSKASEFIDIYRYPPSRPEPIYPTPQVDKTAAKCRKDVCLLPDCSCGGKETPGDLPLEQTPQIVLLTFDDSVNDLNKGLYSDLFEKGRTNPNGCPIAATFYVSHEWTDYSQVQNLYANGHEMASHSVSHSFGEQFSVKKWTKEIAGQREILSAYGGVKLEDIRGMRAPFLSIGGNKMFKMLYDANFTYDSSMPVYENKPPSWPYTLDYKIFHDCMIPPCPTRSYPGVWEVPMVMWQDLNGGRCSMGDACSNPPTSDGVYKMLIKNFERHFTSNRAPFGLFYHAAWFTQPHHKEGFIAFLDAITKMPEVWVVTNWQAVQWVRDPTPISRLNNFAPFQCNYPDRPRRCNNPKVCNLWHKSGVRYMRTCQPCPEIYPWTGKSGVRNSRVDNEIITD